MARPKMTEKAESVKARMTVEEKVAELDRKIQGHEQNIETLKATNESLISTLDEVLRIQREGREKRQAAEIEMRKIEGELKSKLLSTVGAR